MAPLPGVTINVEDGNLGILPGTSENVVLYMGVCTLGTVGTIYNKSDPQDITDSLGLGKLAEIGSYALQVAGGPMQFMPLTPSVRGGAGSVTQTGTGAGVVSATLAPHEQIVMTVTTGGTLDTAEATFAVGGGDAGEPVTLTATPYLVPGTFTKLTFAAGTYVLAETYTVSTAGTVTASGGGPSVTQASSPIDDYDVLVTITLAGNRGTAQFTYSLDGGESTSSELVTAATYAIPDSGVVLNFTNAAYVLDDIYEFQTASPTFGTSDVGAGFDFLLDNLGSISSAMIHVVGGNLDAGDWGDSAAALELEAAGLFNRGVYVRIFNECPTVGTVNPNAGSITVDSADTDSVLVAEALTVEADHVAACAGDVLLTSPLTGLQLRRNCAWVASARAAAVEASQSIGFVGAGGALGVSELFRDEDADTALDAARFITMRTFPGFPGFYLTNGHTMALATSDYSRLTNARVVDLGCTVARAILLPMVNGKVPTKEGGVITETKAQQIEARVDGAMEASLVSTEPQNAVAASVTVNRTHNILADGNLILSIAIQPFAYAEEITANIGLAVTA